MWSRRLSGRVMWRVKDKSRAFMEATEFVRLRKLCEEHEALGHEAASTMYNPLRNLLTGLVAKPHANLEKFLFTLLMVKSVQNSHSVINSQVENAENWVKKTENFEGAMLGHMLLLTYLKVCSIVSLMNLKSEADLWGSTDKRIASLSLVSVDLAKLIGEQSKLVVDADYTPSGSLLTFSKDRFSNAY